MQISYLNCILKICVESLKYEDPTEPHKNLNIDWSFRNIFKNLIGITPEYTKGDRFIAYGIFIHSFVYSFILMFIVVLLWNGFSPWNMEYWKWYFYIYFFVVPTGIAVICTFWFSIGGIKDMFRLFKDLQTRSKINIEDNGRVDHETYLKD